MKIRIKNSNSIKCPKCGKIISPQWFGYRCSRCTYEQLNKEGREAIEKMNWKETIQSENNS